MNFAEILAIAVAVSMDAFAVSICKGLSVERIKPKNALSVALWFGGFQALMPLSGYFLGVGFTSFVENVDYVAAICLALIGANMVKESFSKDVVKENSDFSIITMLLMAVATSIDAFAVGLSLAIVGANVWQSVALIGIITAVFSVVGLYIGNIFGSRYKSGAELAGGIILIVMGIKIFIDDMFFQCCI